ncbi:hypothetical protein Acid345_4123 [Candidatus Koribacter versatilis Ellin345]|uniref:Tetratricopeptide repeat protein n=1 Tax=Koribacter versatilis (strain Ellin345) TaxID=204669 RepID=Q1IJ27_KORVE|nr:carboxypeptidase-like regulatory domain-containing protein [Candidatus Koribacter versatilis]ABF43123.1 hypothetical protein Acid345_4123 [Candidatus Koribacter versatilis Ellin345]
MKMLRHVAMVMLLAGVTFAGVWLAQIEGTCLDEAGNPLANAELKFLDKHNGHRFSVKTDAKGKFFFGGVDPGAYSVTVLRGNQVAMEFPAIAISWSSRPQQLALDLAKHSIEVKRETRQAETLGGDTSPDDFTPVVVGDDAQTVAVRTAIEQAQKQGQNGDWAGAIATLKANAESSGAKYDMVWAQLASAYCHASKFEDCAAAYGKALALKEVGAYYNNRAQALVVLKRWNEVDHDMMLAEKMNPEHRVLYERNHGMMLVQKIQNGESDNTATDFEGAVRALSSVLQEEPANAELYYLRAYCQIRLLGVAKEPPAFSAIESGLRKYLELEPHGKHAEEVNAMLKSVEEEKR